ncbi:MAG: DUF349 domain-containing protein [Myxococcales bacterium]|nr:DUF349 domain-containing protein [Myxococcales bacterium]
MAIADLFRPKHKHSKSDVRAAAVAAMGRDNMALLVEVAQGDGDASIRKSAIAKIEDPQLLTKVAESQDDAALRDYAIALALKTWLADAIGSDDEALAKTGFNNAATHGGDKALAEIAGQAKLASVRAQALARLEDERALMQVVRNSSRSEEWKAALARIENPLLLRSIAIDEKRKEVAVAALDRIQDEALLEEVVGKAKNKAVRGKAKRNRAELVKSRPIESSISDEDKRAKAERAQIAREIEELAGGYEWLASRAVVDEAHARWRQLGSGDDANMVTRFEKALARYDKNHGIYGPAAEESARKAKEAAREEEQGELRDSPSSAQAPDTADAQKDVPTPPPLEEPYETAAAPESTPTSVSQAPKDSPAADRQAAEEDKRLDNQDELERLCEELEELHGTSQMKGFDRVLKDADKARRKIGGLPRVVEETLRERYDEARRKAVIHLGELREADDWKRWSAVPKMEALVVRAKALLPEESEVKNRGKALKTLQREWRELGPSPREKGEELWRVFKATCDEVYEKVKGERDARQVEQRENLEKKEALCVRAEELQSSTDWQETSEVFKELQTEWKNIGPVPRRKSDGQWKRFRGACDTFFEARAPHLEEKFSEEAENLESKTQLIKDVQELAAKECTTPEGLQEQLSAVRELQGRWRDIGKVAHREFAKLDDSYKEACDKVYAKRLILEEADRQAQAEMIASIEATISECSDAGWDSDAAEVAAQVVSIRQSYRNLDAAIPGYEDLGVKVASLIRSQLESEPAAYKGTALDPERSALAREKIIVRAEEMAPDDPEDNDGKSPEEIAEKLRAALADRALGGVLSKTGGRPAAEIIGELRGEWAEIGPVPGAAGTALVERFEAVCERLLAGEQA